MKAILSLVKRSACLLAIQLLVVTSSFAHRVQSSVNRHWVGSLAETIGAVDGGQVDQVMGQTGDLFFLSPDEQIQININPAGASYLRGGFSFLNRQSAAYDSDSNSDSNGVDFCKLVFSDTNSIGHIWADSDVFLHLGRIQVESVVHTVSGVSTTWRQTTLNIYPGDDDAGVLRGLSQIICRTRLPLTFGHLAAITGMDVMLRSQPWPLWLIASPDMDRQY